jgi:hypothetical protein
MIWEVPVWYWLILAVLAALLKGEEMNLEQEKKCEAMVIASSKHNGSWVARWHPVKVCFNLQVGSHTCYLIKRQV